MTIFKNSTDVNMMIWETDPKLRNKSPYNEVCFIAHKNKSFNEGDLIINNISDGKISTYELTDLLNKKQSSQKDQIYYTFKTIYKKQDSSLLIHKYKMQEN
jgi:hypothetical protein